MNVQQFQHAMAPVSRGTEKHQQVCAEYPQLVEQWEALPERAMQVLEDAIDEFGFGDAIARYRQEPEALAWCKAAAAAGLEGATLLHQWIKNRPVRA